MGSQSSQTDSSLAFLYNQSSTSLGSHLIQQPTVTQPLLSTFYSSSSQPISSSAQSSIRNVTNLFSQHVPIYPSLNPSNLTKFDDVMNLQNIAPKAFESLARMNGMTSSTETSSSSLSSSESSSFSESFSSSCNSIIPSSRENQNFSSSSSFSSSASSSSSQTSSSMASFLDEDNREVQGRNPRKRKAQSDSRENQNFSSSSSFSSSASSSSSQTSSSMAPFWMRITGMFKDTTRESAKPNPIVKIPI